MDRSETDDIGRVNDAFWSIFVSATLLYNQHGTVLGWVECLKNDVQLENVAISFPLIALEGAQ